MPLVVRSTIHHKLWASGSPGAVIAKASGFISTTSCLTFIINFWLQVAIVQALLKPLGFKRAQPAVSVTALQEVPPVATILHMEVHIHSDDQRLSNKPHCRHLVRRCHRSLSSGSRRQAAIHITFSGSSSSPSSPSHCSLPCSFRLSNKPHCRHLVRRCHHYILSIKLT